MPPCNPVPEAQRILTICNACRYCEGYCAVFPATERRLDFNSADVYYLANLCHNCSECYYACQYAPPHEFAVNVPKVLAEARLQSYQQYSWPRLARGLFAHSGASAVAVFAAFLAIAFWSRAGVPAATFYEVISHHVMVAIFGVAALLALIALAGSAKALLAMQPGGAGIQPALFEAARSALTLRYLSSGGVGCTYPNEHHSQARRWFHHLTFYGFLLCFASTSAAAFDHYVLGLLAPYPYASLPVVLGTLGGIGLLIGPAGLYWLKRRRDPMIADQKQDGLDITFLALLFGSSLTGLLLMLLRQSGAMPALLLVHLGIVLALFATLPYGKFVHGIYRAAALWRYAFEERPRSATTSANAAKAVSQPERSTS